MSTCRKCGKRRGVYWNGHRIPLCYPCYSTFYVGPLKLATLDMIYRFKAWAASEREFFEDYEWNTSLDSSKLRQDSRSIFAGELVKFRDEHRRFNSERSQYAR